MDLDLLVVGAHPDDIELFCGGTLLAMAERGYRTGVLALTRGELGTRGSPALRAEEFATAAGILKVQTRDLLDIPDGQVDSSWGNRVKVARVIRTRRPALILCPYWRDRHPDHQNASRLVRESAFLAGLAKVETGEPPYRISSLLYYPCWEEFTPSFIVDVSDQHSRKLEAVLAYRSQFHHPEKDRFGPVETPVSRPEFLERIVARAKHLGSMIGAAYGEGFLLEEPLPLNDPVRLLGRSE